MPDDLATLPKLPVRELPKPGKRKPLNRAQIIQICIRQTRDDGLLCCGCGCGNPLDPVCIDEHLVARETLPADRCDHIDNRALFNPECSKVKTVNDQAIIGHWRRARGDSGQQKRRREKGPVLKSTRKLASRSGLGGGKPEGYVSPLSKEYRRKVRERMER